MSMSTRLGAIASTVLFMTAASVDAADVQPRTYRIGMCPWIAWAPTHIAEAVGLWKKLGIEVQVVNQLGEEEHTAAVENKRVDLAIDMLGNFVGMHEKGTDITIIGELDWSHGGDKIILKDKNAPTKAGDTIGIYHNDPAVLMLLNRYLVEHKLKLSDISVAEYDPEALTGHFITGRFSTIISYEPYAMHAEQDGGTVVATTARYPGCMPEGIGGRKDVLATIPKEDLEKILVGWIAGVRWMNEPANWKEFTKIANERTFGEATPYGDDEIRHMLGNVRIHDTTVLRERNTPGAGLYAWLGDMHQMLVDNQMLKRDFAPAALLDTSALMTVLERDARTSSSH